jgi:integrase
MASQRKIQLRNVRLRGSRFELRRKVPLTMRALFKRSEIVVPLQTGSARIAAIRARQGWLAIEGIFRRVSDQPSITPEQIDEIIRRALADLAWKDEVVFARNGRYFDGFDPAHPRDVDALLLEGHAEDFRAALAVNNLERVAGIIDTYAAKIGVKVTPNSIEHRLVGRALLKAFAENLERSAERFRQEVMLYLPHPAPSGVAEEFAAFDELDGQAKPSAFDCELAEFEKELRCDLSPGLAIGPEELRESAQQAQWAEHPQPASAPPEEPKTVVAQGQLLSDAWEVYKLDRIAVDKKKEGNLIHSQSSPKLLAWVCGDRPVTDYTRTDSTMFRRTIGQLPDDYHQARRWRGKSVQEIIELAARIEKSNAERASRKAVRGPSETAIPRLALKTINRHISTLHVFWDWLISQEHLPRSAPNIFDGLHTNIKKSRYEVREERDHWPRDLVAALFNSPIWRGCKSRGRRTRPGDLIIRDWKYWIPLIGAFTGMRREEICSMLVEDIEYDIRSGVWFFNLRRAKRRFKTLGSERYVPIHSALIEFGFLDEIVTGRPKNEYLFPELNTLTEKRGDAFGKFFLHYCRAIGVYREKITFHTFRHSVITFVMEKGGQRGLAEEITGHEGEARKSEIDRYNKSDLLVMLKQTIELLDYEFDTSHLKPTKKR